MPKNYQISQYDRPLCLGGGVDIVVAGQEKRIRLTRIHLEEDVAKNIHFGNCSGIDFNRAGVPLMEIVSEPDMHTPEEAFQYLTALKRILQYADVSSCNLEEGNIRCDVNCSVRPEGSQELGVKTEIKNLNTFKGVLNSLKHEIARQVEELSSGGRIVQETRRWDADTGMTYSMRTKEYAHDYRYFPEPDLMPVVLSRKQVDGWQSSLPEIPAAKKARFVNEYGLPEYDAGVLSADRKVADYFEEAAKLAGRAKSVSNMIMTDMLRLLGEAETDIDKAKVTPAALAELVGLQEARTINSNTAREIFAELFSSGGMPAEIVKQRGLGQVSDEGAVQEMVVKVVAENTKSADDYRAGKEAALKFLIGQVMKLSKGKADPQLAAAKLKELIGN
jgi:aspartyl-tRNA(Asn)/glutamyl-tRNA(Gln) amidotransferase subunit B